MNRYDKAAAFARNPPPQVTFTPVPYRLLRVARNRGEEHVHPDTPAPWGGQRFDPWRKGDLVAVHYAGEWAIAIRATAPSAVRQRFVFQRETPDIVPRMLDTYSCDLWRIPYVWRPAAERLLGLTFTSREALETAMENVK